jgi:hypothetical protein
MIHVQSIYLFMFSEQGMLFRQSSWLWNNDCLIEVLFLVTKGLISLANWHLTVANWVCAASLRGFKIVLYLWILMSIADKKSLNGYQKVSAAHRPEDEPH